MREQSRCCHRQGKFGPVTDICGYFQCLGSILGREFPCELENAVFTAYAHVLLYIRCSHLHSPSGQVLEHLVCLYGNPGHIHTRIFRQNCGGIGGYFQTAGPIVSAYPLRHFIVPQLFGFHHYAFLGHRLVEGLALVCRGPVHSNHQHCAFKRIFAIYRQILQGLHHLGFLHHHKLTFRKHRVTPCGCDHLIGIHIRPIVYHLVEVPFAVVIEGVGNHGIANEVHIIVLVTHKKIHGSKFLRFRV